MIFFFMAPREEHEIKITPIIIIIKNCDADFFINEREMLNSVARKE